MAKAAKEHAIDDQRVGEHEAHDQNETYASDVGYAHPVLASARPALSFKKSEERRDGQSRAGHCGMDSKSHGERRASVTVRAMRITHACSTYAD